MKYHNLYFTNKNIKEKIKISLSSACEVILFYTSVLLRFLRY